MTIYRPPLGDPENKPSSAALRGYLATKCRRSMHPWLLMRLMEGDENEASEEGNEKGLTHQIELK